MCERSSSEHCCSEPTSNQHRSDERGNIHTILISLFSRHWEGQIHAEFKHWNTHKHTAESHRTSRTCWCRKIIGYEVVRWLLWVFSVSTISSLRITQDECRRTRERGMCVDEAAVPGLIDGLYCWLAFLGAVCNFSLMLLQMRNYSNPLAQDSKRWPDAAIRHAVCRSNSSYQVEKDVRFWRVRVNKELSDGLTGTRPQQCFFFKCVIKNNRVK